MKRAFALAFAITAAGCGLVHKPFGTPATRPIPGGAERVYRAVSTRFDRQAAFDVVSFMDRYWRLAGESRVQRFD